MWPPGPEPLTPAQWSAQGPPPPNCLRRSRDISPVSVLELAPRAADVGVAASCAGAKARAGTMQSRFAACCASAPRIATTGADAAGRGMAADRVAARRAASPPSTGSPLLPETAPLEDLVRLIKLRWRIERDYQELKDELGLDHYEGRGWRGFHHHGALCIAAYAFLAAERARLSPPEPLAFLRPARLPKGFRPRGAARCGLNATTPHRSRPCAAPRRAARCPSPVLPVVRPHGAS